MEFRMTRLAAALMAAGLAQGGPVFAEEQERELAPMKVNAEQDKPLQQQTELGKLTEKTPISGAVLDKEEIAHLQLVNNLLELGKRVPGISMVRNMRIPDGGKNYTENRVDGMRVSSTSNTSLLDEVDTSNLERIEIITGPGSALYGSGALGGTISVFSGQPPKDLQGGISQEIGSWDFQRTAGSIGTSVQDGGVGILVAGSTMDNDGWRKSTAAANNNAAAEHKDGASIHTAFRVAESTKLNVGLDRLKYDYRLAGAIPMNASEAAKLKNANINGANLRSVSWANDWQHVVPGTYGRAINDYETYSGRLQQFIGKSGELDLTYSQRTSDGLAYGAAGSGGSSGVICDNATITCSTYNTGSTAPTNTLKKSSEVTKATQLTYRQEFDWLKSVLYVGAEWIDIATDSATYNNSYSAIQAQQGQWGVGTRTATGQGSMTREQDSTPLVHYEFSPLDHLRLHVGKRFDRIAYSGDDRTSANKDTNRTFHGDVWKTGATYDLTSSSVLWGNFSETFNAPTATTQLNSGAVGSIGNSIGNPDLDPEHGRTHELGLRGRQNDWHLHYDVALYHSENRGFVVSRLCTPDEQTSLNAGAACNVYENAGRLTAKGLESMWSWLPTSWLEFGLTYTNARTVYNEYLSKSVSSTGVVSTTNYAGKSYQAMPKQRSNFRVAVKPTREWEVELEWDHMSSYYYDTANSGVYARPDLYNLRASYRTKTWSAWLHVLNLTDRQYATRVGSSNIAGVSMLAVSAGQGNSGTYTPLTVRAGVSYNF
jgi:outer membrane receptor protein involved in Fe transport